MSMDFNRLDRALIFAARAHDGQRRKGTDTPYIAHPAAIAMKLLTMDCAENVVIAALLHDVVEDTPLTLDDISQAFGDDVSALVAAAGEPDHRTARWEVRKEHTINFLRTASLPVKLLSCADKLHNLHSIARDYAQIGDKVWDRFARGREKQVWYYRALAQSLPQNIDTPEKYPIFTEFSQAVTALFGKG